MTMALDTYSIQRAATRKFVRVLCALTLLCCANLNYAQESDFPALTGRVVDLANLLDAEKEASITATLAAHEDETGNQIVVVTTPDLKGYGITDYANRLGRHWEIGTSENDNGVLLVVAQAEKKVRIEVGYGLEGALTDSLSSVIIQREILPSFRKNDYPGGIQNGVDAILQAIDGEYVAADDAKKVDNFSKKYGNYIPLIFIAMVGVPELLRRRGLRRASNAALTGGFSGLFGTMAFNSLLLGIGAAIAIFIFVYLTSDGKGGKGGKGGRRGHDRAGGFGSGGMGGGGGFSGGGGSFGGGGASGSW